MPEKTIIRYLSWGGLFVVGILVYAVIWNWRMLSIAIAFTGLLAVTLATMADSTGGRDNSRSSASALDTVQQPSRRVTRLRALLRWGISCLFS
jgi:hypothetical protein